MRIKTDNIFEFVRKEKVGMIDLKFADLFGHWHHLTFPVSQFDESVFEEGIPFDSSTLPGFKSLESGDMVLIPDEDSALIDRTWDMKTISYICSTAEADTLEPFRNDPRNIAANTEKYLLKTGIADMSYWSPEFEFYIFDHINYANDINLAFYQIDSEEADWNSGSDESQNLGHKIPRHGGYHAIPPLDILHNLRAEMVRRIEECGIDVRYHHHEVGGPGQSEIEINMHPLTRAGDVTMIIKYLIKMTAKEFNKTVTFMPKPLYNEAGSGMHIHVKLYKDNKPLFYDRNGWAGLSDIALYFIGGILQHGSSLLAFTNPSTNSYKRLVPGFEAPIKAIYGLANRSASIRVPKYGNTPDTKWFEFRPPDGTCNIYLALSALLLAGLDGIQKKIDPTKHGFGPYDINIFKLPKEKLDQIKSLPLSLQEALLELKKDHEYLLAGDIFSKELIESWIELKMNNDFNQVRNRPHPYEMTLYYDV